MDHQYTSLQLVAAGHSDPGQRRELNEDAWRVAEIEASGDLWEERGRLFAVADGMGGHAAGEVASQLAIETLFAEYYGPGDYPLPPAMRLEQAINVANGRIYEQSATKSSQAGMGTTIVAAVVRDDWLTVANVGDSRAYLIRDGQVTQITKDHSWVAEQVEAGLLTEQEAEGHMYRSVVTRCLGHRPEAQIDTFEQPLEAGDAILLCSDGLSNQVSDLELAQILARYPPAQGVGELIELANRYGGPDNITAVLLSAREPGTAAPAAAAPVEDAAPPKPKPAPRLPDEEEPKPDTPTNLRWVLPAALTLATLCVVGTGLALWGSGYVRNWLSTATPETTLAPLITATPSSTPTTSPTRTPLPTATPAPPTATPTAPPTLTPTSTPSPTPTTVPTRTPLPDTGPQLGP